MVGDTLSEWVELIYSTIQAQQTTIDSILNVSQDSNDLADYWLPVLTGDKICPSSTMVYFGVTYDLCLQGQCWLPNPSKRRIFGMATHPALKTLIHTLSHFLLIQMETLTISTPMDFFTMLGSLGMLAQSALQASAQYRLVHGKH